MTDDRETVSANRFFFFSHAQQSETYINIIYTVLLKYIFYIIIIFTYIISFYKYTFY